MSLHLTTKKISTWSKYEPCYMQKCMNDRIFKKGIHCSKPCGERNVLFSRNGIEKIVSRRQDEQNTLARITLKGGNSNG